MSAGDGPVPRFDCAPRRPRPRSTRGPGCASVRDGSAGGRRESDVALGMAANGLRFAQPIRWDDGGVEAGKLRQEGVWGEREAVSDSLPVIAPAQSRPLVFLRLSRQRCVAVCSMVS
jgi:hypothetical protein